MRRKLVVLSGILALQAAIAIGLALSRPDYGAFEASEPLVAFDAEAVREIAIDEGGGETVVLRRHEDGWRLPALHDFPASEEKVSDLLERLSGLRKGLPVAVSGSAPKRFKLTEAEHERRIVLRGDDQTLGEVIFGTSPTYRQEIPEGKHWLIKNVPFYHQWYRFSLFWPWPGTGTPRRAAGAARR